MTSSILSLALVSQHWDSEVKRQMAFYHHVVALVAALVAAAAEVEKLQLDNPAAHADVLQDSETHRVVVRFGCCSRPQGRVSGVNITQEHSKRRDVAGVVKTALFHQTRYSSSPVGHLLSERVHNCTGVPRSGLSIPSAHRWCPPGNFASS